nr:hypothetical protein [Tanacetum cinerariifolium]
MTFLQESSTKIWAYAPNTTTRVVVVVYFRQPKGRNKGGGVVVSWKKVTIAWKGEMSMFYGEMSTENGVNPPAPNLAHNSNFSLLLVLGRERLTCLNYMDWMRNLRFSLRVVVVVDFRQPKGRNKGGGVVVSWKKVTIAWKGEMIDPPKGTLVPRVQLATATDVEAKICG